jgi:hypothetical protein
MNFAKLAMRGLSCLCPIAFFVGFPHASQAVNDLNGRDGEKH